MFGNLGPIELIVILVTTVVLPALVVGGAIYGVARLIRAGRPLRASDVELLGLREQVALLERELDVAQHSIRQLEESQNFANRLRETREAPPDPAI